MPTVAESDLQQVLDVLDAARSATAAEGHLSSAVLTGLHALVPSDSVNFSDLDAATCTHYVVDEYDGTRTSSLTEPDRSPDEPFWRHYQGSKLCSYPTDSGDDKTVVMRSDFFTRRQWAQTPMYTDVFAPEGITDELLCPVTTRGSRSRRLIFFRSGGHDYSERDRLVLSLLRPHLAELVTMPSTRPELTPRQTELMRLVAAGYSNAEIAATMVVSPHTVRTHLENIFERLDVSSRTAAVARVFS